MVSGYSFGRLLNSSVEMLELLGVTRRSQFRTLDCWKSLDSEIFRRGDDRRRQAAGNAIKLNEISPKVPRDYNMRNKGLAQRAVDTKSVSDFVFSPFSFSF